MWGLGLSVFRKADLEFGGKHFKLTEDSALIGVNPNTDLEKT